MLRSHLRCDVSRIAEAADSAGVAAWFLKTLMCWLPVFNLVACARLVLLEGFCLFRGFVQGFCFPPAPAVSGCASRLVVAIMALVLLPRTARL